MSRKIGLVSTKDSTARSPFRREYMSKRSSSREPHSSDQHPKRGRSPTERRRSYNRHRSGSPLSKKDDRHEDRSPPPKRDDRRGDRLETSSHIPPPASLPHVPPAVSSQMLTGDRGLDREKSHLVALATSGAQDGDVRARMEMMKRTFPKVVFDDTIFVPNLKRIP